MSGQPAPERVRVSGPLLEFVDGFRIDLLARGYSLWGAQEQLYLLAHVSRWMESEGLDVSALTRSGLERYFVWRRGQGYLSSLSPLSLRRLLGYLGGLGVLPAEEVVLSPVDRLLDAFREYLLGERGMKASSAAQYEPTARLFLSEQPEPLEDALRGLSAAEINVFVLREARRRSVRSAETVIWALRALLRFLHVQGLIAGPLAEAVPSVARRREDLPRALPAGQVNALLDSCGQATRSGRRDRAILLLLSRLGLRRGEVAALALDDVDWRAGEIVVHGKGSRIDRLPLPVDVGEAIVEYLRHERPRHQRLAMVRGFARYLHAFDARHEVPPVNLLPAKFRRAIPYLFSDAEILALLEAARSMRPPLRAASCEALLGLLVVSGMRVTEACRLDRGDVELAEGRLTVRQGKNGRSREIPLHPSTVDALARYARARDELCPVPKDSSAFFLSGAGGRLYRHYVWKWFDQLRHATGLDQETLGRRARLHDVRHGFVLRTLIGWYRDGGDIEARLPLLSTMLGHVHPADTLWYLEATPELLALACERLERTWQDPPPDAKSHPTVPLFLERSGRTRAHQIRRGKGRR